MLGGGGDSGLESVVVIAWVGVRGSARVRIRVSVWFTVRSGARIRNRIKIKVKFMGGAGVQCLSG